MVGEMSSTVTGYLNSRPPAPKSPVRPKVRNPSRTWYWDFESTLWPWPVDLHLQRSPQALDPEGVVEERVCRQPQRLAVIRKHDDQCILQGALGLEHRNEFAEHAVGGLQADPVHGPVFIGYGLGDAERRIGRVIRPMRSREVRNEERGLVERHFPVQSLHVGFRLEHRRDAAIGVRERKEPLPDSCVDDQRCQRQLVVGTDQEVGRADSRRDHLVEAVGLVDVREPDFVRRIDGVVASLLEHVGDRRIGPDARPLGEIETSSGHRRRAAGQDRDPRREGARSGRGGVGEQVRLCQEPVEVRRYARAAEPTQLLESQRVDAQDDDVRPGRPGSRGDSGMVRRPEQRTRRNQRRCRRPPDGSPPHDMVGPLVQPRRGNAEHQSTKRRKRQRTRSARPGKDRPAWRLRRGSRHRSACADTRARCRRARLPRARRTSRPRCGRT